MVAWIYAHHALDWLSMGDLLPVLQGRGVVNVAAEAVVQDA
jgi:hypothetical protein